MTPVSSILLAYKTHERAYLARILQAHKLYMVGLVMGADRTLPWLLRQRNALVLDESACRVSTVCTLGTQVRATDSAVDRCDVLFILVTWYQALWIPDTKYF